MQYYHYNGTHSSKCHTLLLSFQMETEMFRNIHFIIKRVYKSSNSRKSINFLDFHFTFSQQRCQISKINTFMVHVSYNTICNFKKIEKYQHSQSLVVPRYFSVFTLFFFLGGGVFRYLHLSFINFHNVSTFTTIITIHECWINIPQPAPTLGHTFWQHRR